MDAGVCVYKCGWCDRPVMVRKDPDDGNWYIEFDMNLHGIGAKLGNDGPCGCVRIEDASEAVKDARLFERRGRSADEAWYIVENMIPEALWRLELAGDSGCKCFFDHFCHDMMHKERLKRFERTMAEKRARLAKSAEKSK